MKVDWEEVKEQDKHQAQKDANRLPLLPVKNTVLFPEVVLLVAVSRKPSVRLVKRAFEKGRRIAVVAQIKPQRVTSVDNLYKTGTTAKILKIAERNDGTVVMVIQGLQRFKIVKYIRSSEPFSVRIKGLKDRLDLESSEAALRVRELKKLAARLIPLTENIPEHTKEILEKLQNLSLLTHVLCTNTPLEVKDKQEMLEMDSLETRVQTLSKKLQDYIHLTELKEEIHNKVYADIDQQQRDYFLRQQMKILQNELGAEGSENELERLTKKAAQKKWSSEVRAHFDKEIQKLRRAMPGSPEYATTLNYVEFLLNLPWAEYDERPIELTLVRKVLDKHHYGIVKVKERVLEYLSVLSLRRDMKSPILCLCAPPGVGKTSLGQAIAASLRRKYVRLSLGGLHDEAELRGHRKTYIGAMPGKIVGLIARAKRSNPVFVLDEIDKIGRDFRGDPAAALLEVLDPEQNSTFTDNYLEVPYDVSRVLFIATANSLDTIHPALLDRMEVIHMSGYTKEEKKSIATRHLIPKLREDHGLKSQDFRPSAATVKLIIDDYTQEAGVRQLSKRLSALMRSIAKSKVSGEEYKKLVGPEEARRILGVPAYEDEPYEKDAVPGVAVGLAWTPYGGEVLYIESLLYAGKGKLILSGQLGNVMQESAQAALSYVRSEAKALNIDPAMFERNDVHIHIPSGAIPKDGPSAGITLATSIASLFTKRIVKPKLAMTGEITLSGRVLPVGGIKEKLLAAKGKGMKDLILCAFNQKHVDELDEKYTSGINIHYVKRLKEVFSKALS